MSLATSPLMAFHLIGERAALGEDGVPRIGLRPALFGRFAALERLRYDYPVVLLDDARGDEWAVSLSDAIDRVLRDVAQPGPEGEEMRRQVLALEQIMRTRCGTNGGATLAMLWDDARTALLEHAGARDAAGVTANLRDNLDTARAALACNGRVFDCAAGLAARMLTQAWSVRERAKAGRLARRIERLVRQLHDLLDVDDRRAPQARTPERLAQGMGASDRNVFDFEAMARVLKSAPVGPRMDPERRQRIENTLAVLQSQRFVSPGAARGETPGLWNFRFTDCGQALAAFRHRLPALAELVKAMMIAGLEAENRYVAAHHDRYFAAFDESSVDPGEVARFPGYLVCLDRWDSEMQAAAFAILCDGLPFKILAPTDDLLGGTSLADGLLSLGLRGQQAARMALGLGSVFVLQAAQSSLYRLRAQLDRGLAQAGPALFHVYAGGGYLDAAAATESRVFPSFVYDPAVGSTWAERFSLEGNPQVGACWPMHELRVENARRETVTECTAFTLADYVVADHRFASHFACVAAYDGGSELEPLDRYLDLGPGQRSGKIPYVSVIDAGNTLQRAVVDAPLVDAARRCRDAWRSLQELAGIGNSHVAAAESAWEAERERLLSQRPAVESDDTTPADEPPAPAADHEPAPADTVGVAADVHEEAEPSSDDPWIETIRCTTCNECTQINDRMFGYDADKRAHIVDADAGTYRQLVEAAESCQVAIIHPGKPRNPDEPGLDDLMRRAEPFL